MKYLYNKTGKFEVVGCHISYINVGIVFVLTDVGSQYPAMTVVYLSLNTWRCGTVFVGLTAKQCQITQRFVLLLYPDIVVGWFT